MVAAQRLRIQVQDGHTRWRQRRLRNICIRPRRALGIPANRGAASVVYCAENALLWLLLRAYNCCASKMLQPNKHISKLHQLQYDFTP